MPRVLRVDFGDGYVQRVADGLNNLLTKLSLSFAMRTAAECDAIEAFLKNENGVTSFYFTMPGGTQKKYICSQWNRSNQTFNCDTISTTFEEVVE